MMPRPVESSRFMMWAAEGRARQRNGGSGIGTGIRMQDSKGRVSSRDGHEDARRQHMNEEMWSGGSEDR